MEYESIEFRKVTFGYGSSEIFHRPVNLFFHKGEITALTGENGCGKTTLVNLLLNIWDNYTGDIFLGERNIRDMDREELLEEIGFCFQKVPLFYDTIENNITMGKELDRERLLKCLQCFSFAKEIDQMEEKEKTVIGSERKLSGGQAQKLGVIRVVYGNSPVMIFDEPTANMDEQAKEEFIRIISREKKDKIIILVSHDQEIIRQADVKIDMNFFHAFDIGQAKVRI